MLSKGNVLHAIEKTGIIAIVRGVKADAVLPVANALYAGGVRVIEVTCNTPGYLEMIRLLTSEMSDKMIVGAGTVLNAVTAELAVNAGAQFALAPDLNPAVIAAMNEKCLLTIPGVATPSEIMQAHRLGVDVVKLFPAGSLGAQYIKELRGPLSNTAIIPVGGVTLENAAQFAKAGAFAAGVGGELVDKNAIAAGDYAIITGKAKCFMETFLSARNC